MVQVLSLVDDCALVPNASEDRQVIIDSFSAAYTHFKLIINVNNTKSFISSIQDEIYVAPKITNSNNALLIMDKIPISGSALTCELSITDENAKSRSRK